MPSEAQKRARDKWDATNMTLVSCKMRRDLADEFKSAAKANGTTPGALIRGWIDGYMQKNKPVEQSAGNFEPN